MNWKRFGRKLWGPNTGITEVRENYLVCLVLVGLEPWDGKITFNKAHWQSCFQPHILMAKFLINE
jgi:hypothetical protein